jgi:CheY-like chemotaxis protein
VTVRILVVDDEPDIADLFRQQFRREAKDGIYALHFARSAAEALDRIATEIQPALMVILSDINMPGMDGLTLLQTTRAQWPEIPVVMVTAYGDEDRLRRAEEIGAAQFITKPVDFALLKAHLRELQPGS